MRSISEANGWALVSKICHGIGGSIGLGIVGACIGGNVGAVLGICLMIYPESTTGLKTPSLPHLLANIVGVGYMKMWLPWNQLLQINADSAALAGAVLGGVVAFSVGVVICALVVSRWRDTIRRDDFYRMLKRVAAGMSLAGLPGSLLLWLLLLGLMKVVSLPYGPLHWMTLLAPLLMVAGMIIGAHRALRQIST